MAVMLTTEDNPYDPLDDFPAWYAWDMQQGYNTCAYLARVLTEPDDFPQEYNDRLVEQAIDEIIEIHAGGLYKKIKTASP
jgi:hypothetical protein